MTTMPNNGEKREYWTDDIHLAVYMKVKGARLLNIVPVQGNRDRNYCRFLFGCSQAEGQRYWELFQNAGDERKADVAEVLREYDSLRGQRHKAH